MKLYYLILGVLLCSTSLYSQSSIYGKITDKETGEELVYTNIVLLKNGNFINGASTDFEGNYSIAADPGTYEVKISYTGYPDRLITDMVIKKDASNKLDVQLEQGPDLDITYMVFPYGCIPVILLDEITPVHTIYSEDIRNQSTKNVNELLLNTAGVSINNF